MKPAIEMEISRESLEALELGSVLSLVAEGAVSDAGRQLILEITPTADRDELAQAVARGLEVDRLLEDGSLIATVDEPLLPTFQRLFGGRLDVDGADLVTVRTLLRATRGTAERISRADPPCPTLAVVVGELPDLSDLAGRLDSSLDDRGRVRDEASPLLVALRRKGQQLRQAVYKKLEAFVREHGEDLAEDTVPLHEERLVVLLRSGSKGRFSGLVHGRSASGQSFYFEPMDVVESNNELRTVHEEAEAERARILRQLVEDTVVELKALSEHLEFLAEIDFRQAAARWAGQCDGRWVLPRESLGFRLVGARHPLLDPRLSELRKYALGQAGHSATVEPLSVTLEPDSRVLVITGPNAGGKTVALKTMGLVALMAHCGLPVPVGGSTEIPLLEGLVATVGDEQDMLTDRSTFSGRLMRLEEAWKAAGPRSLILLDELGSGTDPEEGAALGVALIEGLVSRQALAAVSSHLTRVAAAALDLDGASCAAMAFNAETGVPTFRLVAGTPGSSEALALARRLGLPTAWIERAEELLGDDHGQLQKLLAEVEHVRGELASQLTAATSERRRLDDELKTLEAKRQELERATRLAAEKARAELRDFRHQVQRKLQQEVDLARKKVADGRSRGLAADVTERLFKDAPVDEADEGTGLPVRKGGLVRHRTLRWEGLVQKVERGRVQVSVQGKRVVCGTDEMEGLPEQSASSGKRIPVVSVSTPESGETSAKELNLRGERVEEALARLDLYLDRSLLAGLAEVRIVHGHGTGKLKVAVREALGRHPAVANWRPADRRAGGDGATIAVLAG